MFGKASSSFCVLLPSPQQLFLDSEPAVDEIVIDMLQILALKKRIGRNSTQIEFKGQFSRSDMKKILSFSSNDAFGTVVAGVKPKDLGAVPNFLHAIHNYTTSSFQVLLHG